MKIVSKLTSRVTGEFAVKVAESHYIVYTKGEVSFGRIIEIFPGKTVFSFSRTKGWERYYE